MPITGTDNRPHHRLQRRENFLGAEEDQRIGRSSVASDLYVEFTPAMSIPSSQQARRVGFIAIGRVRYLGLIFVILFPWRPSPAISPSGRK
jgi:hypothetical protein